MGYELQAGETLGDGVRRVCCDQIQCAIEASKSAKGVHASPVHATRRHLKKARAALRLLSRHVAPKDFKREHRNLRAVGRLISEVRDAEVRLGTVQELRHLAHRKENGILNQTEDLLAFELESFFAAFSDWAKEAQTKLPGVRRRMARWHLVDLDCKQIRCTVQNTYKRGRKALAVLGVNRSADNFHELRKQAKELMFHLRILRPLHRATFKVLGKRLADLGDLLGQANDLAFLRERLEALHGPAGMGSNWKALCELIASREAALQGEAVDLAEQFYAERPLEFTTHIVEYFEAWEDSRARVLPRRQTLPRARENGSARRRCVSGGTTFPHPAKT